MTASDDAGRDDLRAGPVPRRSWWLRRAGHVFAVLAILSVLLAGCQIPGGPSVSENTPCGFGALVLVPVVCVRAEPDRQPDGTWSYPLSNPKAAELRPGSILVVARKSVRRVESVRRVGGRVILTTAAVPLTEVVKDGTIPLRASITPHSVETTVDQPGPQPPPEPAQVTVPTPTPAPSTPTISPSSSSSTASSSPVVPVISASVRAIRNQYRGDCATAASAGLAPTFEATISVSAGPVTVDYHWTRTDRGGQPTSITRTLTFPGTGPQTQTDDYSLPVDQYPTGVVISGQISLQVDKPRSTAAPEQPYYEFYCHPVSTGSPQAGGQVTEYQPARLLAHVFPSVDGYQIQPSLTLGANSFAIDVIASRQVGLIALTWKVHAELGNFLSGGAVRIVDHQLRDSGLDTSGLRGQLRFDWSLSAAVPEAVRNSLSLDLPIRLFVEPLLVGDFPVFLAVDINLHTGPEFTSAQALHGYASVSFGGGQGLRVHLDAIDSPIGPSIRRLGLETGIRDLLGPPSWTAWVEFPYLSLGDDFYSTGAWLWVSPRAEVSLTPGHDPNLCARAEADASSSAGIEFQLFGLRNTVSAEIFHRPLSPAASFPRTPECITS
jgi:hypothetical protein